ncbi:hypothetical protein ACJBU6_08448 [Exserohilum turcicum]
MPNKTAIGLEVKIYLQQSQVTRGHIEIENRKWDRKNLEKLPCVKKTKLSRRYTAPSQNGIFLLLTMVQRTLCMLGCEKKRQPRHIHPTHAAQHRRHQPQRHFHTLHRMRSLGSLGNTTGATLRRTHSERNPTRRTQQ